MTENANRFRDELAAFDEARPTATRPAPRSAPPDRKTEPFSLRLTAEERELVHRAAAVVGAPTPAGWARAALLEAARPADSDDREHPAVQPPGPRRP